MHYSRTASTLALAIFTVAAVSSGAEATDESTPLLIGSDAAPLDLVSKRLCHTNGFVSSFARLYNAKDLVSIAALAAPDVRLIKPGGEVIVGPRDYVNNLRGMQKNGYDHLELIEIASASSDAIGYSVVRFRLSTAAAATTQRPLEGLETYVFHRAADGRCLLQLHTFAVPCGTA